MIPFLMTLLLMLTAVFAVSALIYFSAPIEKLRGSFAFFYKGEKNCPANTGLTCETFIPAEEIPTNVILAVLVTEDPSYFSHSGFNWESIRNRIRDTLRKGAKLAGGSSISQQLVKVVFTKAQRSLSRKYFEALYCIKLEKLFSKYEILCLYLSTVRFGAEVYGIRAASLYYFKKPMQSLSIPEAVMLAIFLRAPSYFDEQISNNGLSDDFFAMCYTKCFDVLVLLSILDPDSIPPKSEYPIEVVKAVLCEWYPKKNVLFLPPAKLKELERTALDYYVDCISRSHAERKKESNNG